MFVLNLYFSVFSLWSFGYKLYSYGHTLAPTAVGQGRPFMPPMFGYKQLANFEVYSYPAAASYAMVLSTVCPRLGRAVSPGAGPARGGPRRHA